MKRMARRLRNFYTLVPGGRHVDRKKYSNLLPGQRQAFLEARGSCRRPQQSRGT